MKFVPADASITAAEVLEILEKRIDMLEEAIEDCEDNNDREIYEAKRADALIIRNRIIEKFEAKVPEMFVEERVFA